MRAFYPDSALDLKGTDREGGGGGGSKILESSLGQLERQVEGAGGKESIQEGRTASGK